MIPAPSSNDSLERPPSIRKGSATRGLRAMLLATAISAAVPGAIASTTGQEDPDGQPMTPVELGIPAGMSPKEAAHLASERIAAERRVVLAAAGATDRGAGVAETPPTLEPGRILEVVSKAGGGELYRIDAKQDTRVEVRATASKGHLVLTFYDAEGVEFGHEDPAPSVFGWANANKGGVMFIGVIGAEPGTKYTLEFKQTEAY